jgi:hypothetical protein
MSQSGGDPERRRQLRRKIRRFPAAFEAGSLRGTGHLKNVSKDGVFVRSDTLPAPGEAVRLIFHDLLGSKVEVHGVVQWTTAQLPDPSVARSGFGLRIPQATDGFLDFFEQLITR